MIQCDKLVTVDPKIETARNGTLNEKDDVDDDDDDDDEWSSLRINVLFTVTVAATGVARVTHNWEEDSAILQNVTFYFYFKFVSLFLSHS